MVIKIAAMLLSATNARMGNQTPLREALPGRLALGVGLVNTQIMKSDGSSRVENSIVIKMNKGSEEFGLA
jgi:hypothetical protein